jgi:parallel beta-helix repeat protein
VWITDNRIQGAGTYGIRLLNADQLVLRNNNVAGSGGGPTAGAGRYPAIYLPAVSADFTGNVRGNVGGGNGLDALVFDGKVTGDLSWVTPSNTASTHALGYLLDGGLTLQGGKLVVGQGAVVKSLGGPITINGGNITATGLPGGSPTSNNVIFTSLKDNPSAPSLPVDRSDAAAVSCPSVLVSVCSPGPGDWGGLVITSNAAGLKGTGAITYGLINYANTGISLDSGPIPANPEVVPANFRLTVSNTTIANASKDGVNSLDTPFSVDSGTVQNVGANGIIASFFSPANCSSTPGTCVRLNVTNSHITGTGKDGIIANGLSGQPTVISNNTITDAGAYGIRLVGADQLTLTNNHVRKSALPPATALRYPAIYLSSVKADFEKATGTGAIIQGNDGRLTGLDAIVFHGEATKKLTWITAAPGTATDVTFGYLLDGQLTVDGDFVTNGDIVKITNGGIKINGGSLQSVGTTFTSLKDNPGLPACHSVFIPDACPTLPNTTLATNSDWSGISIDGTDGGFNYGKLLYASSGVTINSGALRVKSSLITGLTGYAVTTTGTGSTQIDCASIHDNGGGVSANGAATTAVTYSNLFANSSAGKDFSATVAATATSDWWGVYPPLASQYDGAYVTVSTSLTQEKPALKTTSGAYVASDNTNANGNIGKGKLTVTFNREMNTTVQPVFTFVGPDAVSHAVAGTWSADMLSWTTSSLVDSATSSAGANLLAVSQGASCIPDGHNLMDPETNRPFTLDFTTAAVAGTGGATGISGTTATLNDSVNPNGWSKPSANPKTATFAFFQLRVNGGSYDASVASVVAGTVDPTTLPGYASIGYGTSATALTFGATGLTPNTSYDYRVVAFDLNGYTIGADQHFTTLNPVPNAPTAVTASPGNGKATVSWTPPTPNGGTAITSYTATASPGGAFATTLDGVTTSIDVTGLTNGTAYTVTVVASNAAGNSAASSASTAITVGTPPAPGSPNAAAGSSAGQAVLTWTVPADNGSAIVSYTVTPYDGTTAGTPIVLLGSSLTGTTVTGLVSGHTYTFTVFATNGNGNGSVATTNAVVVP